MDAVYTEKLNGLTIKIIQDDNAESPSEWGDNNLFLTGYHRDFSVSGPCGIIPEHLRQVTHKSYCTKCYQRNFETIEQSKNNICGKCKEPARVNKTYYKTAQGSPLVSKSDCIALVMGKKWAKENGETYPAELAKKYHVFGLEAYIHSGVTLALANEGKFVDRQWDVSLLGAVFCSKKEWRTRAKAKKSALGLIGTWNDCLSGNVYGYVIENVEAEEIESCWGYYGDYDAKGGVLEEARSIVKSLTNDGKTDHKGQKLMEFVK